MPTLKQRRRQHIQSRPKSRKVKSKNKNREADVYIYDPVADVGFFAGDEPDLPCACCDARAVVEKVERARKRNCPDAPLREDEKEELFAALTSDPDFLMNMKMETEPGGVLDLGEDTSSTGTNPLDEKELTPDKEALRSMLGNPNPGMPFPDFQSISDSVSAKVAALSYELTDDEVVPSGHGAQQQQQQQQQKQQQQEERPPSLPTKQRSASLKKKRKKKSTISSSACFQAVAGLFLLLLVWGFVL